jgi:hypothetical protein
MEKQMVDCEDGRRRQARVYGFPTEDGHFEIGKAGVRLKGKHVSGEAWYGRNAGLWYFLTCIQIYTLDIYTFTRHNSNTINLGDLNYGRGQCTKGKKQLG